MAFVHRTNRENCRIGGFHEPSTENVNLGPGSYNVPSTTLTVAPSGQPTRAPFFSSSRRGEANHKTELPGPGAYDHSGRIDGVGGKCATVSFKSKVKRMANDKDERAQFPGPGEYYNGSTGSNVRKPRQKPGNVNAVIQSLLAEDVMNPPSIPSGDFSYGYRTAANGKLLPRKTKSNHNGQSSAPGPGDYYSNNTIASSKGVIHFSKQVSRQGLNPSKEVLDTPGPGQYYNEESSRVAGKPKVHNPALLGFVQDSLHSSFASKTKRGLALQDLQQTPGPGSYDCTKSTITTTAGGNLKSTSQRFADGPGNYGGEVPGPGAYYSERSFHAQDRGKISKHRHNQVPFSSTCPKMGSEKEYEGPGFYSIPGMFDQLKLKQPVSINKRNKGGPAFGSTGRRFHSNEDKPNSTNNQTEEKKPRSAGPAKRRPKSVPFRPKKPTAYGSVFNSKSKRWDHNAIRDGADPGTYNIHELTSFVKETLTKRGKGVMMSGVPRFTTKEEDQTLGPGQYDFDSSTFNASKSKPRKQVFFSQSKRFVDDQRPSSDLGPGAYTVMDNLSSFVKPSFNLTIAEEEQKAFLRAQRRKR